ncbi:MAG: hypothetical protein JXB39_11545 [Deltaproteobacteria bacterium]|nr:hypothetical protein [Deltaproteobacteria bacterium]
MRILALSSLVMLVAGCHNPCQQLCDDMFEFAKDCGFQPTEKDLEDCYREQASAEQSRDKRTECRIYADDLRDEWTCDNLVKYFDDDPGDTSEDAWIDSGDSW